VEHKFVQSIMSSYLRAFVFDLNYLLRGFQGGSDLLELDLDCMIRNHIKYLLEDLRDLSSVLQSNSNVTYSEVYE
jgi:hypothetical protein